MRYKDAAIELKQNLQLIYDPREAGNITHLVLNKLTGKSRSELLINPEAELSTEKIEQFQSYLTELMNHRPIQYVLKEAWFANRPFFVDERVLIPRPETEELTDWATAELKTFSTGTDIRILDIGTGSGCIAITLKKNFPQADVWAIDMSDGALEVARSNVFEQNVQMQFRQLDILDIKQWNELPEFDLVISNPPYIPPAEKEQMDPHVLRYEPHAALFVTDEDPLQFYRVISDFFLQQHRDKARLFFETHEQFAADVSRLLASKGLAQVKIRKDLQGKERMVMAIL